MKKSAQITNLIDGENRQFRYVNNLKTKLPEYMNRMLLSFQ